MPCWEDCDYCALAGCKDEKCGENVGMCTDEVLFKELQAMTPFERRKIMALENIASHLELLVEGLDTLAETIEEKDFTCN